MIYYDNGYKMSTTKVHYTSESEGEVVKFIPESKEYWQNFHDRGIIELKGFIEEDNYTDKQRERLKKINELKIQEGVSLVETYILEGKFEKEYEDESGEKHTLKAGEGHPLQILKLSTENEKLEEKLNQVKKNVEMDTATSNFELMGMVMLLQAEIDALKEDK